jgi:hypothetical protein
MPRIAGVNTGWSPRIADVERLIGMASGFRGKTHAEIAREIGIDVAILSPWLSKMRAAVEVRPFALANLRFLMDLRASGARPPPIQPSDILRRADSLSRAKALAAIMPAWPAPPPPRYTPGLDSARSAVFKGGWQHGSHGSYRRRAAIDDDDGDDGE